MRPVAADSQDVRVADVRVQLEAGKAGRDMHRLLLWVLNFSDGDHTVRYRREVGPGVLDHPPGGGRFVPTPLAGTAT
jgi:hypothetical protein